MSRPEVWEVTRWAGAAADFHALDLPPARGVWIVEPSRPALVLGSSQPEGDVDEEAVAALGAVVARRRSGGGAVWVHPADSTWIDVMLPRGDALWCDDVTTSMMWLGEVFVRVFEGSGAVLHRGAFGSNDLTRRYCFGGAAPGEVLLGGAKLVGMSQRRTVQGARIQCVMYHADPAPAVAACLSDADLRHRVAACPVAISPLGHPELVEGFLAALPH